MNSASSAPDYTLDPWFRHSRRSALVVAAALFVAILAVRLSVGSPLEAYSMFYVLPIALVAVALGVRGGLGAALLAIALTVVWVVVRDVSLTPTGWLSRAVPMLLLGGLLGSACDRLRQAEAAHRSLAGSALLHRRAIEINDSLVQGMVAAKWSLEAGRTDAGLATLNDTISRAQDLVSDLIREADMEGRSVDLEVG